MTTNHAKYRINNDADLCELWQRLMGPRRFGWRSLWMIFLDEQSDTLPLIIPIDELPDQPDELLIGNLATVLREVQQATAAVAVEFLLSRPGTETVTDSDRRWARALLAAVPAPTRRGPIHLATTDRIRVLAPDDLIGAAAS